MLRIIWLLLGVALLWRAHESYTYRIYGNCYWIGAFGVWLVVEWILRIVNCFNPLQRKR